MNSRHKNIIEDIRSLRGADCDSDHYMVGFEIRAKIKTTRKTYGSNEQYINTEILKDISIRKEFEIELNNRSKGLELQAQMRHGKKRKTW